MNLKRYGFKDDFVEKTVFLENDLARKQEMEKRELENKSSRIRARKQEPKNKNWKGGDETEEERENARENINAA